MSDRRAFMSLAVMALLASCAGADEATETREPSSAEVDAPTAGFVVVTGDEGSAVTDGRDVVPVTGVAGIDYAAALPGSDEVAVVASDQVALLAVDGTSAASDCLDCSGIAVTGEHLVTTRSNLRPRDGFDIVVFDHELGHERAVPAERLPQRRTEFNPLENAGSPTTLAADADRVTVAYLSLNGSARGGPDIVANYSYDGELLDSVFVDGLVWRSAPSPDGRYLALAVGGSGGACVTVSDLAVLSLEGLDEIDVGPSLPPEEAAMAAAGGESEPWFDVVDLVWRGTTVEATGEVFRPGVRDPNSDAGSCDHEPDAWRHTVDVDTGDETHSPAVHSVARSWVGPECDDTVELVGMYYQYGLVAHLGGTATQLGGDYQQMLLSRPPPDDCPVGDG